MYDIGYFKIWSALQVQPQVCFFFIGVHYQFDSCFVLLRFSQYKQLNKKIYVSSLHIREIGYQRWLKVMSL